MKNFVTCKSLCNLQKLYTAFKEKYSNINIGFRTFCALRPKWCSGWLKNDSLCVCSTHENVLLLVDAMEWALTYKDLIKKIVCNIESNKFVMHQCESCPGTAALKEFLDQEINEHGDDEKLNYCQWDTTNQAILTAFTTTCEEQKETLIDVVDDLTSHVHDLTRHSYIAKLNTTSCRYRRKSKATTGVQNTASYIPWLYTTWDQMVPSKMTHCNLVLMTANIAQAFCIKFKQCLCIILKLISQI